VVLLQLLVLHGQLQCARLEHCPCCGCSQGLRVLLLLLLSLLLSTVVARARTRLALSSSTVTAASTTAALARPVVSTIHCLRYQATLSDARIKA